MNEHYQKLEEAKSKMFAGVGFAITGVILTAVSSVFFDNRVVIFWGLVVFGGIQFIAGVFDFLANGGLGSIKQSSFAENNLKCNHCKKENDKNSKFCIFCGSQIFKDKENVKSISLQECIVTLLAYVAKADGVVSSNEAKIISELLDHISDNSQTHRDVLKEIYNIAKNRNNRDYVYYARTLHHISQKEISISDREDFLKICIRWLVYLVYADNVKNIKQSIVVDEIARVINISEAYLNSLHKEFDDKNNNKSKTYHSRQLTIGESYDVLKCLPNSTNDEIKKAYRELVKQYHPDTLQSKELSEDFIIFANEKLQEINNAYEIIKKHRGI